MLQYLLSFQEIHEHDPTEAEQGIVMDELEQRYPSAAPFLWKTVEFELTNLRAGMC